MKRLMLLTPLLLVGCATATTTGSTWQVTEIYDGSDTPASLGDQVAGSVLFTFGASTLNGETSCGQFQAGVRYQDGENIYEASDLEITEIAFDPVSEDCNGTALHTHEALKEVLVPGTYSVRHDASDLITILDPATINELEPVGIALVAENPREH